MEPLMPTVTGRSRPWTITGSLYKTWRGRPLRGAVAGRAGAVREVELDLQAVQPLGRERHLAGARPREHRSVPVPSGGYAPPMTWLVSGGAGYIGAHVV